MALGSKLLEPERPRLADSKNSMARSSRLISGKAEPLTVLTNLPLGGAGRLSAVVSGVLLTGRENWLRLRERRWWWWREEEEVVESSAEELEEDATTGVLLVVDLNAAVAIEREGEIQIQFEMQMRMRS